MQGYRVCKDIETKFLSYCLPNKKITSIKINNTFFLKNNILVCLQQNDIKFILLANDYVEKILFVLVLFDFP